jgi:hypothetical protein
LAEPHRGEDDGHAGELAGAQRLLKPDPAGEGGDDGAEESEEADLGGGQPLDPAEPEHVGDGSAGAGQPQEPGQVGGGDGGWDSLDGQGERDQKEATGDELPGGESEKWGRSSPPFGQHDAGCHGRRRGESGGDAGAVEPSVGPENEEGDSDDAEDPGDQDDPSRSLP